MKVRIYRNNAEGAPRFKRERLPIAQTLVWAGPLFILVQR